MRNHSCSTSFKSMKELERALRGKNKGFNKKLQMETLLKATPTVVPRGRAIKVQTYNRGDILARQHSGEHSHARVHLSPEDINQAERGLSSRLDRYVCPFLIPWSGLVIPWSVHFDGDAPLSLLSSCTAAVLSFDLWHCFCVFRGICWQKWRR